MNFPGRRFMPAGSPGSVEGRAEPTMCTARVLQSEAERVGYNWKKRT